MKLIFFRPSPNNRMKETRDNVVVHIESDRLRRVHDLDYEKVKAELDCIGEPMLEKNDAGAE